MGAALAMVVLAAEPPAEWGARHAPPEIDLRPYTPAELWTWFKGGEPHADRCEKLLAWAARARGGIDLSIAEGLDALGKGDRLAQLGYHLSDYGREVLDLGKRSTETLARLGRELRTRPLLREALRAGRVRIRAAEVVLNAALGEAEEHWVEQAATLTVRQLEDAVRGAGADTGEAEERWLRFAAHLDPADREVVDEALETAGHLLPGSPTLERLEAISQEFLGQQDRNPEADEGRKLGPSSHDQGEASPNGWSALRGTDNPAPRALYSTHAQAR